MTFKYCPATGQKVAEDVCTGNLASGKCYEKKGTCLKTGKKRKISEKERTRRSELMRELNAKRAEKAAVEAEPRRDIEDTDTEG